MKIGRKTILAAAALLAAGAAAAAGWMYFRPAGGGAGAEPAWMYIDPADAGLVVAGRGLYEANCAQCHGFSLEGRPNWRERGPDGILPAPPHNETGHTWHHPDAVLFATVKRGGQAFMPPGMLSGMPAYAEILSDREIEAVLAYIKSYWPREVRQRQEMANRQSRPKTQ